MMTDANGPLKQSQGKLKPLGKWSSTTCKDIELPDNIKCKNCGQTGGSKRKRSKRSRFCCERPWSSIFKNSREHAKRFTYTKVWSHLSAKGYIPEEEEIYDVGPFRPNIKLSKTMDHDGCTMEEEIEKEKSDETILINNPINVSKDTESNASKGEIPSSLPSDCNGASRTPSPLL